MRQKAMWPDRDISYVQLPEDEAGQHFGFFVDEKLVSVVSLFVAGRKAQFRKFATLPEQQGRGYGTQLLHHLKQEAAAQGVEILWCNARQDKAAFYKRFGLSATEEQFRKGGQHYVIMQGNVL